MEEIGCSKYLLVWSSGNGWNEHIGKMDSFWLHTLTWYQ